MTRLERDDPGEGGARKDVEQGPRRVLVDVGPWAVLLEQLMEVPAEGGGTSEPGQGGMNDQPEPRRWARTSTTTTAMGTYQLRAGRGVPIARSPRADGGAVLSVG